VSLPAAPADERRTSPLVGHVAVRLRMVGALSPAKLAAAGAVMVVFAAGRGIPAWTVAAAVAAVLGVLCAYETAVPA
jgi:hypothetical protein